MEIRSAEAFGLLRARTVELDRLDPKPLGWLRLVCPHVREEALGLLAPDEEAAGLLPSHR